MIPLAKPSLSQREADLVLETLRSGRLSLGPRLPEFEDALAGWLGTVTSSEPPDPAKHAETEVRSLTGAGAA